MQFAPSTVGLSIGVLLCAIAVALGARAAIRIWLDAARREKGYRQGRQAFRDEVERTLRSANAKASSVAWQGTRPFRVAAVVDEALDVKSYYLTPADGLALPSFEPGQYLTFHLKVPGQKKPVVRCYSLSDRPQKEYYRVTVKRMPAPSGRIDLPPGLGSNYFHNLVKVGDTLDVQAPRGAFFLDPTDDAPVVLIGGGIGITPLLGMLNTLVHEQTKREFYLLLQMRNSNEHPFQDSLAAIAKTDPNLHSFVSYSQPLPADILHADYDHQGRIDAERIRDVLPSSNFRFYLCGPGAMMESLVPALANWGVPDEHIHYEAFGPASIKSERKARDQTSRGIVPSEIRFSNHGKSLTWDGSHESLLEFGEAHEVPLESGCRAGNCGQCVLKIVDGKVETIKRSGVTVESGHCLACVSVPAGPLEFEV